MMTRWTIVFLTLAVWLFVGCSEPAPRSEAPAASGAEATPAQPEDDEAASNPDEDDEVAPLPRDPALDPAVTPAALSDADWRALLGEEEYRILRESGTEYRGTGRYLDNEDAGAYHCAGCGQRLYSAEHKFHSGCGWPSFNQEVEPGALRIIQDDSHGMSRTEMRCASCDGHLGHIFADAPNQPTGLRHCVNGNALIFIPEGVDPKAALKAHREASQKR